MSEAVAEKPKKKKKKGLPLKLRAQIFLASLMEVSYSAKSEEKEERIMARVALAGTALALFLMILGVVYMVAVKDRMHPDDIAESERQRRLSEQQDALSKPKKTSISLGVFQLEIKRLKGEIPEVADPGARLVMPPQSMAEFELVAECIMPEACSFLERNGDLMRSEVSAVLLPVDREEVTTRDGRDKIKKTITQRLNALVPVGQIEAIYFSTFVVN